MAKKRVRKNYYKNSHARQRARFFSRILAGLKVVSLAAGFAATSLLSIFVYDAVTQSSYFAARSITVKGHQRISRDTILKQAGLTLEDNVLSVNVNALRSRILMHPWIASAEVKRELPDAIHIQVKEHVPIAITDLGEFFYIGEDGKIFKPVLASDQAVFPRVTGLALDLDLHDPWRSRLFTAVMEILRLSRSHRDMAPFYALHGVHVDKEIGVTLYASFPESNPDKTTDYVPVLGEKSGQSSQERPGPIAVKIGFGDYASKHDRLRQIVSQLSEEGVPSGLECIDLNDADRVVVRPSPSERRSVAHGGGSRNYRGKEV